MLTIVSQARKQNKSYTNLTKFFSIFLFNFSLFVWFWFKNLPSKYLVIKNSFCFRLELILFQDNSDCVSFKDITLCYPSNSSDICCFLSIFNAASREFDFDLWKNYSKFREFDFQLPNPMRTKINSPLVESPFSFCYLWQFPRFKSIFFTKPAQLLRAMHNIRSKSNKLRLSLNIGDINDVLCILSVSPPKQHPLLTNTKLNDSKVFFKKIEKTKKKLFLVWKFKSLKTFLHANGFPP